MIQARVCKGSEYPFWVILASLAMLQNKCVIFSLVGALLLAFLKQASPQICDANATLACRGRNSSTTIINVGVGTACWKTTQEDLCFAKVLLGCNATRISSLQQQWDSSPSGDRRLCQSECSSYQNLTGCANMVVDVDADVASLTPFCRSFNRSRNCSANYTAGCNDSQQILESLVDPYHLLYYLAYCSSGLSVNQTMDCDVTMAADCFTELHSTLDQFLKDYRDGSHSETQLIKACKFAHEAYRNSECYQTVVEQCANVTRRTEGENTYKGLLEEANQICNTECDGIGSLSTCVSLVKTGVLQTDLLTFCQSYLDGLNCVNTSTPGCNISISLFEYLLDSEAVSTYNDFCLQGGILVNTSCYLDQAELCFMELQNDFDFFLSNFSNDQVANICLTATEGNNLTACFNHSIGSCPSLAEEPINIEYQALLEDMRQICRSECSDVVAVLQCHKNVDYTILTCQTGCSVDPFCSSYQRAWDCIHSLNCSIAEDLFASKVPTQATTIQKSQCGQSTCFDEVLLQHLESAKEINKDTCLSFLQAFACVVKFCGNQELGLCISRLEPRVQKVISSSLPSCNPVLGSGQTVYAGATSSYQRLFNSLLFSILLISRELLLPV